MEEQYLRLIQILPIGRHFLVQIEPVLVFIGAVLLRKGVCLRLAVVILHQEARHLVVRPGGIMLVDSVLGYTRTPGLLHPS